MDGFRISPAASDRLVGLSLRLCALLAAGLLALIVLFIFKEALPALVRVGDGFVRDDSWHPTAQVGSGTFGLWPMLAGTLLASAGALLLAGPLGLLSAVFLNFYAPPALAGIYRRMVQLTAGIPSVVYGLWGLTALVPLVARFQPPGPSLFSAALVLAVMVLPTVALLSDSALAGVKDSQVQAAAALGLSRWAVLSQVAVPSARSGIAAALLLALARALGETMAVLMVAGNVVALPGSLFDPVRTLTANMALEMAYATGNHRSALFVSGLLLLGLVTALVVAGEGVRTWGAAHRAEGRRGRRALTTCEDEGIRSLHG